ncbi:MAG: phage major capsid protein [Clostridia bacterium]|nr:phage major capsid protein [Clostridia bacterium]
MAKITNSGTLFKPELASEIISKVQGHSALAKLCGGKPIPFAGTEEFIFTMDGEASVVGEAGAKPANNADWKPVVIKPIKFIYQHRVTDEFVNLATEKQIPYMAAFTDGFSKKIARALDIAGFHGVNPYSGNASELIGDNSFDGKVTKTVNFMSSYPDDNIDTAIGLVRNDDNGVTGIAMSPNFGAALGAMKMADSHAAMYPEFRFGGNPSTFAGGLACDINNTVNFNAGTDEAVVGDFANMFRWGYAERMKFEIITTGDPDGLGDLKRYNQVCLRAEAYIGWGILDPDAFARIVNTQAFAVPSVSATAAAKMFEVNVSSLQSGVTVSDGKITGTLKYMKADNGITSVWGKGNFLCLDFSASDWTAYKSVMVGLDNSQGSGLADILSDPDKNGLFKITDKNTQRLMIVTTSADGKKKHVDYYDLTGLTCEVQ